MQYQHLVVINKELSAETQLVCCYCGDMFDKFLTRYGYPSRSCHKCKAAREKVEANRPDRVRNYRVEKMKHLQTLYNEYIKNAAAKDIAFNLTIEEVATLVTQSCTYCGYYKEGEAIGIDRIDSKKPYSMVNVTPCCWPCNQIKNTHLLEFFLDHVHCIYVHTCSTEYISKWSHMHVRKIRLQYEKYKRDSITSRHLEWTLSKEEFTNIQTQPCYLCGYKESSVGIDRIDSKQGYIPDNVRPCCTICNKMKNDSSYEAFMGHIERIVAHQT